MLLGKGGGGMVFQGEWRGISVAVKVVQQVELQHQQRGASTAGTAGASSSTAPSAATHGGRASGSGRGDASLGRQPPAAAAQAVAAALPPRWPSDGDTEIAQQLQHPHVMQTYAYAVLTAAPQNDTMPMRHESHIVLELCDGGSLRSWLDKRHCVLHGLPLPPEQPNGGSTGALGYHAHVPAAGGWRASACGDGSTGQREALVAGEGSTGGTGGAKGTPDGTGVIVGSSANVALTTGSDMSGGRGHAAAAHTSAGAHRGAPVRPGGG